MGDVVRASDAERDAVLDLLGRAAAEGRLDPAELDRRTDAALAATTRADLEPLTADLPTPTTPVPTARPGPMTPVERVVEHSSLFGDVEVAGALLVPEHARWRSVFGDVVLDLRRASTVSSRTHLEAASVFGDLRLVVADGTQVEVAPRTVFGDLKQRRDVDADPAAPCVVLTGSTVFGDVEVYDDTAYEKRWSRRLGRRLRGEQHGS